MRHAAGGSNADVNEVITLCTAVQISQFNLTSLTSQRLINKSQKKHQSIILFTNLKYDCIFTISSLSTAMFIFLLIF